MKYTPMQIKVGSAIIKNVCNRRVKVDYALLNGTTDIRKARRQKKLFRKQERLALEYMGITFTPSDSEPVQRIDYHEYLQSPEWKAKADDAKARAGYRCQLCNSNNNLHAHHRTYERLGNELPEDITVLCSNCHAKFHEKSI